MCSIFITKSITPPPSAQPKQWKLPCVGRTVNEGVFSSWKGQRPLSEPAPARRRATYSPITSSIRTRSRISAMSLSRIRPATGPSVGAGSDSSGRQGLRQDGVGCAPVARDGEPVIVQRDAVPQQEQERL